MFKVSYDAAAGKKCFDIRVVELALSGVNLNLDPQGQQTNKQAMLTLQGMAGKSFRNECNGWTGKNEQDPSMPDFLLSIC